MNGKFPGKKIFSLFLLFLIAEKVLANDQQKGGGQSKIPKGCSQLSCVKEEQCISRKFWCKNPPCPQITYCSKSRKESLKGPSSCSSVWCSKGYVCLVKVRNCTWDENCKQQIARCVTEREYYEGPATCADFQCPDGHTCILRESLCARPPCKVLKSCARNADADTWFRNCKEMGCLSEHECFLRRPMDNCINRPCKHTPDCIFPSENDSNENCRGWVCPKNQDCSAQVLEPCKQGICKVARTCKGSSNYQKSPTTQQSKQELKTLTDLEKDWFYQEEEKRRLQATSMTRSTPAINRESAFQNYGYDRTRQLFFKPGESPTRLQGSNFQFLNNARSVPIYKYPTYLATTPQTSQIFSPDKTTVKSFATTSSPPWLESLKSGSGIDVINFWVQEAEQNKNYMQFQQWLESVRETLDPEMYRQWLEEVRSTTSYSKKFQDWLPLPVPNKNFNVEHFSDFESKINDMESEVLSAFPKSTLEMREYKEQINILTTTPRTVNKLSNDIQKIFENSSEMRKSPAVPTFIIVQTPRSDKNFIDSQQLIQLLHSYFSDPRFLARFDLYPPEFQVPRPPINNFMSQVPIYPYWHLNHFPFRKSTPGIQWQHLLNTYPRNYPVMPQINRNLISPNYLSQYLLSLQGLKPVSQLNPADFGYQHFVQEYPAILNNRPEGIYNQKDYFEIPDLSFDSRRKFNWRNHFDEIEDKDLIKGEDEDLRSKIDQLGHQIFNRKPTSKFNTNPQFNESEKEEQEIEFLLKILQGIIDYDLDGDGQKEKNGNGNGNEVLLETLMRMLEEELVDSQENIKNPKLEALLDEIEKEREEDSKIPEDEFKKFHESFSGPRLRRRKGDEIFRSPKTYQDLSIFSKNTTLVENLNSLIEKYTEILSRKDFDKSIENLSKFFNPKDQNSYLNISLQEIPRKENNSPEIILPKAGYYDFVKNPDSVRSRPSGKNSTAFNKEIKQIGITQNVKNISRSAKESNEEYEDD